VAILDLKSVRDTSLWKRLDALSIQTGDVAGVLAANLVRICDEELASRMKAMPTLMAQYTLHDHVHGLRVAELMWMIMPESVRELLNAVELALVILSAFGHDQGMVMDAGELEKLASDDAFRLFERNWELDHPNVETVRRRRDDDKLSKETRAKARQAELELHGAMLTDYVRRTHGQRSADFLRKEYATDERLDIGGSSLAELAARLSLSHVKPADDLSDSNGFRVDERIATYSVNMQYLGVLLRLADILDFDRDRTPDSLYRSISFRSPVSLREWEKHRSVHGWVISRELIQYTLRCEHPEYQRAAYQYMDWIDQELVSARRLVGAFPAAVSRYRLELPLRVDRSRIEPKDNAYIYRDLEFSLSRDEIVKLLMTDQLYGSPSLAVRELLQNALDAVRHRRALMKREGLEWIDGHVTFQHELDPDGFEILRCTDNGIGMTEDIIDRFLTRAGRSYYRSPEFEQERASFRAAGVDFDPIAQFGIGFMSCFMIGDEIMIRTRRDFGPGRGHGDPLIVQINGLGGMVVTRQGDAKQPVGTSIEIRSRQRSEAVDADDEINLIEVLDDYAIAVDFPIEAISSIPGMNASLRIESGFTRPLTFLERQKVEPIRTFEVPFHSVSPLLEGAVRASFLADENGNLVIRNGSAEWRFEQSTPEAPFFWRLYQSGQRVEDPFERVQVACDGILVAGPTGRVRRRRDDFSPIGYGLGYAILNVSGALKPRLTPARTVPNRRQRDESWRLLDTHSSQAWAELLEQVAASTVTRTFWRLADIEDGVLDMQGGRLWGCVEVPVTDAAGVHRYLPFSALTPVQVTETGFLSPHGRVTIDGAGRSSTVHNAIIASSRVSRKRGEFFLLPSHETYGSSAMRDRLFLDHDPDRPFGYNFTWTLEYAAPDEQMIAVSGPVRTANLRHPLIAVSVSGASDERIVSFARAIRLLVSDPEVQACLNGGTAPEDQPYFRRTARRYLAAEPYLRPELRPPYLIGIGEKTIAITADDLRAWATAATPPT
jgi:hypothetical protein